MVQGLERARRLVLARCLETREDGSTDLLQVGAREPIGELTQDLPDALRELAAEAVEADGCEAWRERVLDALGASACLLTEQIPELEAYTAETGKKLPLLRDVDTMSFSFG